jgi:zinc protease
VFVGSFDIPTIKPLIEKYLGSLPSIKRKETWKDIGVRTPNDVVIKRVEKGVEPKSSTAIVFSGPFEYTQTNRVAIRAMTEILAAPIARDNSRRAQRHLRRQRHAQLSANSQPGICDHD